MTAKVIRIPEYREREADAFSEPAQPEATAGGWDPYEVWVTRVLQPRLDEARPDPTSPERPGKRSFLDWFRRTKTD